jgi:hypothetical protein
MASKETIQAIRKYLTCDRSIELVALRERFKEDFDWCVDQSVAAALAYMIAKDELAAEKKEEEEEPDVYDKAVEVIKKYCHPPGNNSAHTATDEIFTLIYEWLDEGLAEKGMAFGGLIRRDVRELFKPFVIEKSE